VSAPLGKLISLTWRESRGARRRLLLYMSAISLGVAALVAIDSFADNVTRSIREQSRSLLGGDIAFSSRRPFTTEQKAILDTVQRRTMRSLRAWSLSPRWDSCSERVKHDLCRCAL
jgi:putative ABC transport system permease protein